MNKNTDQNLRDLPEEDDFELDLENEELEENEELDEDEEELDEGEEELDESAESNKATIAGKNSFSKSELMAKMVSYASGMKKENLAQALDLWTKTTDQIYDGNKAATAGADHSGKNKASIKSSGKPAEKMKKLSMKEDLVDLFGSTDLSEEFKTRTEALFEAALQTRFDLEKVALEEEFESALTEAKEEYEVALEEAVTEILEDVEEKVNDYLSYAVKQYIEENQMVIENNLRVEVTESFLQGLKGLFEEHYVEIPDDKVDVVESLSDRVEELEEEINTHAEKNIELTKQLEEMYVAKVVSELSEGLTDTQRDKFTNLVESVDYSSIEEFETKAETILESYIKENNKPKAKEADMLLNEEVEEVETKIKNADPVMRNYIDAVSKTIRR
jgi:hypothetical protein